MRTTITVIIALALVLALLTACGSQTRNDGFSDKGFELACAALDTANDYIDHKITANDAIKKLQNAHEAIKKICDKVREENGGVMTGSEVWRDGDAEHLILMLWHHINLNDQGTEPMSEVVSFRDKLSKSIWK